MKDSREKEIERLYEILLDLFEAPAEEISQQYMAKTEDAVNLFVKLFVKPQVEGVDELPPVIFDRKTPKKITYGCQENETVTIRTGVLNKIKYSLSPFVGDDEQGTDDFEIKDEDYVKERNSMVLNLLGAAAHEFRHLFQYRYILYQTGEYVDDEKKALYEKILGEKAGERVRDYVYEDDTETSIQVKAVMELCDLLGRDIEDTKEWFAKDMTSYRFYKFSSHETDSRKAQMKAMIEMRKEIVKLKQKEFLKNSEVYLKDTSAVYNIAPVKNVLGIIFDFNKEYLEDEILSESFKNSFLFWVYSDAGRLGTEDVVKGLMLKAQKDKDEKELFKMAKNLKNGGFLWHIFEDEEEYEKLYSMLEKHGLNAALKALEAPSLNKEKE